MPRRLLPLLLTLLAPGAQAAILRGHVRSAQGRPVPGARIQLIQGPRSVADTISGPDGEWEIRTDLAGRFLLLTSSVRFAPQVGNPFYAGRTDLLTLDIALDPIEVTPQTSALPTLLETPLAQLTPTPLQVSPDQLLTHPNSIPELRPLPSAFVTQLGPSPASPAFLFLRGAPPAATQTLLDALPANPLSTPIPSRLVAPGAFDLASASSSGLAAIASPSALEIAPAPTPLRLNGAQAAVLALHSPAPANAPLTLVYSGDAGSLGAYRDEVTASTTYLRADALASFGRFDQSGDPGLPDPSHLVTSAAALGYHISAGTSLDLTLRDDVSATAPATQNDFFPLQPSGEEKQQNLYAQFIFDTRTAGNWHQQFAFGIVRQRGQLHSFSTAPQPPQILTLTGANGYSATGSAAPLPLPPREDTVTNRDVYTYATDAPLYQHPSFSLTGVLTLRVLDERLADILPAVQKSFAERYHTAVAAALEAQLRHRLFAQFSGSFDRSTSFGSTGSPALGLTWIPVFPGRRSFRGTALHLTAAAGQRELTLEEQLSLAPSPLGPRPVNPRTRTFETSVDQTLLSERLVFHAGYFHSQFAHEPEPLSLTLSGPLAGAPVFAQTLAFRAQGLETSARFHPIPRVLFTGGYTYLAALVEQSASTPVFNPALTPAAPALPIGALTALPGARPFNRPPHSGFLTATYTGPSLAAAIKASFAGRSDSSTFLLQAPALLLPNNNLSPAFVSLDANLLYKLSRRITAYTQLSNLLDNRHLAPYGFRSQPFSIRAGLRLHLLGD